MSLRVWLDRWTPTWLARWQHTRRIRRAKARLEAARRRYATPYDAAKDYNHGGGR